MINQNATPPSHAALASVAAEVVNGSCPLPDVATAGQPRAEQFRRIARAGYRSIIDLRPLEEPRGFDEKAVAREAGLVYERLPVTLHTLRDADFDRLRALLKTPELRPAMVHCVSANRVGGLLIPYLILDEGHSPNEALAIAIKIGLRSQELAALALRYAATHGAR